MKKLLLVLIPAALLSCEQYKKSQDSITAPVAFVDGMLRFESFEALHSILESLEKAEEKIIDNGNTDSVLTIVNQSLPPGKLKDILLQIKLLSDTVLTTLLKKDPPLPPGILKEIFIASAPFTDRIEEKLKNSNLPKGILKDIFDAADSFVIIPDPVLDEFEESLNFISLRKVLEQLADSLLRAGVDPEIQDADDFFIPDFLRTFLNPALEIKVGSSIFKFADTNTILEITDANATTLDALRELINIPLLGSVPPFDTNLVGRFNNLVPIIIEPPVNGCILGLAAFQTLPTGVNQISFDAAQAITHFWDFGDGSSSTLEDPVYTYSSAGTFLVIHTSTFAGGCTATVEKNINVGGCTADFDTTITKLPTDFLVDFDASPSWGYDPSTVTFEWDFGDGSPIFTTPLIKVRHNYPLTNTCYTVKLTIKDEAACFAEVEKELCLAVDPCICCRGNDNKHGFVKYDKKKKKFRRKVKGKLTVFNALTFHRLKAKTVNYKKVLGIWVRKKADQIHVSMVGHYWRNLSSKDKCKARHTINPGDESETLSGKSRAKVKPVSFHSFVDRVWVGNPASISSAHYVIFKGAQVPSPALQFSMTNKGCTCP